MTSPVPAIVADSNVVSYIGRQSPIAQYYLERFAGFEIAISFQTVEEAWFGAYLNNESAEWRISSANWSNTE